MSFKELVLEIQRLERPPTDLVIERFERAIHGVCPDILLRASEGEVRDIHGGLEDTLRSSRRLALGLSCRHPDAYLCLHAAAFTMDITTRFNDLQETESFIFFAMAGAFGGNLVAVGIFQASGSPICDPGVRRILRDAAEDVRDEQRPNPALVSGDLLEETYRLCHTINYEFRQLAVHHRSH